MYMFIILRDIIVYVRPHLIKIVGSSSGNILSSCFRSRCPPMCDYPGHPFPFPTVWHKQSRLHFFSHYARVVRVDCIYWTIQYYQVLSTGSESHITTLHISFLREEQKGWLGAIWNSCFVHNR
jgi:hypothetical protein